MDGDIVLLPQICDLAEKYDALVMVDDSHATGYIGTTGRGTVEHCGVQGRVDIISTTFGKPCGASGGCISGSKEIIDFLRQKSRPYLFSNTLAPGIVGGVLKVMEMISASTNFRDHVITNANYFRRGMIEAGFDILASDTAIVPVMIYQELPGCANGGPSAQGRDLCDWFYLPGGACGAGQNQGTALSRPLSLSPGSGDPLLCEDR